MRLSLTTKIFLGFVALLGIFALLALVSVQQIQAVASDLRTIKDGHIALAKSASKLATHHKNRFRYLERALEETDPQARQRVISIVVGYFPEVTQKIIWDLRQAAELQMKRPAGPNTDHQVKFYGQVLTHANRLGSLNRRVDTLTTELLEAGNRGLSQADVVLQLELLDKSLTAQTYTLDVLISAELDRAVHRTEKDQRAAVVRIVVMSGIAMLIGLFLTFLAARALAPIRPLVQYSRAISRGDYDQSIEVPGAGELASLAEELRLMARARKDREQELDVQAAELETAYRRVEELKRYHESIVRSLRTGVIVTDRNLEVTSTNPAAQTHWALSPDSVRGKPLDALPLGTSMADRFGPLSDLIQDVETKSAKAVPLAELLADVTVAPLENEKGAILGLVITLEDVTEAVRTKEALIRSERLAAIGRMSAHVTHEIRNPLSSIGLNAEMLEDIAGDETNAEEARTLCRAIVREVDRLTAITDEYLRFARLPRPVLRDTDIVGLVRAIEAFVRRDCEAANVNVQLELPSEAIRIHIDSDQIRSALLNLVRNAKESMPEGGNLTLSVRSADEELVLEVRDEGMGIDPQSVDRIFDPFYSTKLTGTGLGLALTQQIISEHRGQLEVSSQVDVGTEFRIRLPQKTEAMRHEVIAPG